MAKLKEKKFGYVVQPPPPPPCPLPHFPVKAPFPIPPGMNVQDWTLYINSYIDVRARQLYDKLKKLMQQQQTADNVPHDAVFFRDQHNNKVYKMFMYDGVVCTTEAIEGEYSDEPAPVSPTIINNIVEDVTWDDQTH